MHSRRWLPLPIPCVLPFKCPHVLPFEFLTLLQREGLPRRHAGAFAHTSAHGIVTPYPTPRCHILSCSEEDCPIDMLEPASQLFSSSFFLANFVIL